MDDRLSPAPGGFSEALAAQLPAAFALSTSVIDFDEVPWSEVIHRYSWRRAPRVSLAGLPEPMRQELAWWLCSLHSDGERVNAVGADGVGEGGRSGGERSRAGAGLVRVPVGRGMDSGRQAPLLRASRPSAGGGVRAQPSCDDRAPARRA